MKHTMKKRIHILSALILTLAVSACAPAAPAQSAAASISIVLTDQWPDNAFTQQVPRPQDGQVVAVNQGSSQEWEFCSVSLSGVTKQAAEDYLDSLGQSGFVPVSLRSETMADGSVVIGNVYQREGCGVAVSLGGDTMAIYIALPADRS